MSLKHSVVKFKFEGFESLTNELDVCVTSEEITDCHGNIWRLNIYPGGGSRSEEEGLVGMYLYNKGRYDVRAKPTFIIRGANGEAYHEMSLEKGIHVYTFDAKGRVGGSWGDDIIKRSEILDKQNNILLDGALLVDVHLQFQPESTSLVVPPSPHSKNMLKLLDNPERADVKFEVMSTVITAHKLVLEANAPILFDFCKGCKEGEMIKIDNISPAILKIVLRYVYGGEIPDKIQILSEGDGSIGRDTDRFGIVSLKLAVEKVLVENLVLNKHNCAQWLLFAESKTCALLKEAAIAYFVARSKDLLQSKAWEALSKSPELVAELMKEMSNRIDTETRFGGREGSMSVIELRYWLSDEGLDLDGSKEILVSRLKESNKRQRTE